MRPRGGPTQARVAHGYRVRVADGRGEQVGQHQRDRLQGVCRVVAHDLAQGGHGLAGVHAGERERCRAEAVPAVVGAPRGPHLLWSLARARDREQAHDLLVEDEFGVVGGGGGGRAGLQVPCRSRGRRRGRVPSFAQRAKAGAGRDRQRAFEFARAAQGREHSAGDARGAHVEQGGAFRADPVLEGALAGQEVDQFQRSLGESEFLGPPVHDVAGREHRRGRVVGDGVPLHDGADPHAHAGRDGAVLGVEHVKPGHAACVECAGEEPAALRARAEAAFPAEVEEFVVVGDSIGDRRPAGGAVRGDAQGPQLGGAARGLSDGAVESAVSDAVGVPAVGGGLDHVGHAFADVDRVAGAAQGCDERVRGGVAAGHAAQAQFADSLVPDLFDQGLEQGGFGLGGADHDAGAFALAAAEFVGAAGRFEFEREEGARTAGVEHCWHAHARGLPRAGRDPGGHPRVGVEDVGLDPPSPHQLVPGAREITVDPVRAQGRRTIDHRRAPTSRSRCERHRDGYCTRDHVRRCTRRTDAALLLRDSRTAPTRSGHESSDDQIRPDGARVKGVSQSVHESSVMFPDTGGTWSGPTGARTGDVSGVVPGTVSGGVPDVVPGACPGPAPAAGSCRAGAGSTAGRRRAGAGPKARGRRIG